MKKVVVVLCFISLFFVGCRSKNHTLENIDKIDIEIRNGSILNFKDVKRTITDQTEISKIIKLVESLKFVKGIDREKYYPLTGAHSYYLSLFSKEKLIREYKIYGDFLTIKNSIDEEAIYYLCNGEELKIHIKYLANRLELDK